jgi:hypothetical protein
MQRVHRAIAPLVLSQLMYGDRHKTVITESSDNFLFGQPAITDKSAQSFSAS